MIKTVAGNATVQQLRPSPPVTSVIVTRDSVTVTRAEFEALIQRVETLEQQLAQSSSPKPSRAEYMREYRKRKSQVK